MISQVFIAVIGISSVPLWIIGDFLGVDRENDQVTLSNRDIENLSLDPEKTEYRGFSLSTFQNTSDPHFARSSDWGNYVEGHQGLGLGQGVDILTPEGREIICNDTIAAGGNIVRFSVEWADVSPNMSVVNQEALARYVETARYIRNRGLTPMVTLHHFATPLDEDGNNAFENSENIELFVHFSEVVYDALKDDVHHFMTFNEPGVHSVMNYILGDFPAGNVGNFWKHAAVMKNLLST
ncbi:MAG: glycoside hydrolase family 1 protein [Simkaniaceae bacterium]|nr:glycoside hydrolase family 1 protein [Simkaniaceae bacterium]